MANHTPGPWMMTCGYVREIDGCHDLSVFITKGRFIAEVAYNDPEQEANACLIAAAPDLLAACEAALPIVCSRIEYPGDPCEKIANGLRTAILKANAAL